MPSVFVSYATADRPIAEQLSALLADQEIHGQKISVWRDQEQLYGGQKWPKALGEAIAGQDYFLLLWSQRAAQSHFVEFEWNTAIALKKPIIPCLLDTAPLPPSLAADQGIVVEEPERAFSKILAAFHRQPAPKDPARTSAVLGQLAGIEATKDKDVAQQVKSIFAEQHWSVQGDVYQAGGDINVSITHGPRKEEKALLDKWQAWVVIVGGILAAILAATQIKDRVWPPIVNNEQTQLLEQPLAGTIHDEHNDPLPEVEVALPEFKGAVTKTDRFGRYALSVNAPREKTVTLVAQKPDYETQEHDATLGNVNFDFTMQRKQ